jgi:hypothetical protein
MAESNESQIEVFEDQDGSATVELPDDMANMVEEASEGVSQGASDANHDDGGDEDQPSDTDELREARRNRRRAKKESIRAMNREKDVKLAQFQRENDELKRHSETMERRLAQLERNTKAEQITRIEKSMDDANVRLEYAKMKLAEATQNQDGQAMVEAQMLWQNAQDEVKALAAQKYRADVEYRQSQEQPQVQLPNTTVQRLATDWMRRNPWYNPQVTDADSKIAKKIDEMMTAMGKDPSDPGYWKELDSRLREELPHRYNDSTDDDSRGVRRPRNVVGSSGREASAAYGGVNRSQFILSPDRVKAMKEAGAWDNPERKAKMIKQFIAYDRANRS